MEELFVLAREAIRVILLVTLDANRTVLRMRTVQIPKLALVTNALILAHQLVELTQNASPKITDLFVIVLTVLKEILTSDVYLAKHRSQLSKNLATLHLVELMLTAKCMEADQSVRVFKVITEIL